ncbi:hypothetical protein PR048_011063 [Dryococelus australis]|uniref:Uncharacterized protein n=1 Tax=Dryococelus australis TaxID=614101 RepID=A0ABQ9HKL2_9NEOP|nr:hypothetical protein PR048_011063 [Dryococelus australis]
MFRTTAVCGYNCPRSRFMKHRVVRIVVALRRTNLRLLGCWFAETGSNYYWFHPLPPSPPATNKHTHTRASTLCHSTADEMPTTRLPPKGTVFDSRRRRSQIDSRRKSEGFVGDSPFSLFLHSGAAPYSPRFTYIGSRYLDRKCPWLCRSSKECVSWGISQPLAERSGLADSAPPHAAETTTRYGVDPSYTPLRVKWELLAHEFSPRGTQLRTAGPTGVACDRTTELAVCPGALSPILNNTRAYEDGDKRYIRGGSGAAESVFPPVMCTDGASIPRRRIRQKYEQAPACYRGRIVASRDCGLSYRKIGSRIGINETTKRTWDELDAVQEEKQLRRNNEREGRHLPRMAITHHTATSNNSAQEFRHVTHLSVSARSASSGNLVQAHITAAANDRSPPPSAVPVVHGTSGLETRMAGHRLRRITLLL